MARPRWIGAELSVVALALAIGGCGSSDDVHHPAGHNTSSPEASANPGSGEANQDAGASTAGPTAPEPTGIPTFGADQEIPTELSLSAKQQEAARASITVLYEFYRFDQDVLKSGGNDGEGYEEYSSDQALLESIEMARSYKEQGITATGTIVFDSNVITEVDLAIDDDTSIPFVRIVSCFDAQDAGAVDEEGTAITSDEKDRFFEVEHVVAETGVLQWRVSEITLLGNDCET